MSESQLHGIFAGSRPGVLVSLKLARALGENPVEILRLAGQHEAAELLAVFIPEGADAEDLAVAGLQDRMAALARRGLGARINEALSLLEAPWEKGRDHFSDIVQTTSCSKAVLLMSAPEGDWRVVFQQFCADEDLKTLLVGNDDGWESFEHKGDKIALRLHLLDPSSVVAGQIEVYLRVWTADFTMFL